MPYDKRADHLLTYFRTEALAQYQTQPDKYNVQTDNFEGEISTNSDYFLELEASNRTRESISVRFGYRTKADGELALVVWTLDLVEKSPFHVERWSGFEIDRNAVSWIDYDEDTRFSSWVRRYLEGSWDVENGPGVALAGRVALINGLTLEAVGIRLFDIGDDYMPIAYPIAENTHRYADAHRELYGYLVDGIDRKAVEALGRALGTPVNCASDRTLQCLRKVLPELDDERFSSALAQVSDQRRLASHKTRPPARAMRAFESFTADLRKCVSALELVIDVLERRFHLDASESQVRQDALRHLRPFQDVELPGNYSIHAARAMAGKTVERVEVGERGRYPNAHGSEAIRIHFTDGSIVSLETGSNAWNLSHDLGGRELNPQDFHVDFIVQWVPPRRPKAGT